MHAQMCVERESERARARELCTVCPHPIACEGLCAVLVDDAYVSWRLDPGLSIHLDRNPLIPQDRDLHRATLQSTSQQPGLHNKST